MKLLVVAVGCLVAVSAVSAASTTVKVGERTFYVDTGTDDGSCRTKDMAPKGAETICEDGANVAAMSTETGCLDSAGKGYCAVDLRRPANFASSQLTCASGASYFLYVGPEATCRLSGTSKTCFAKDGSEANADCDHGCGNTKNAGTCCTAGLEGCPPSVKAGS